MIERFQGEDGRRRLLTLLVAQRSINGDEQLARDLADKGHLEEVSAGASLIAQGASDNDLFLIVVGRFSVVVNGREVAVRGAGTHVGELAVVDPAGARAASVLALEDSVVLRVAESAVTALAQTRPELWRRLAIELCSRLRQRNDLIRSPNPRPVLFVGSSKESLGIARGLQLGLSHDDFVVRVWTNGVFLASGYTMESLEEQLGQSDFATLIVSPDDVTASRGHEMPSPRDNVIFELGLFMGALGRRRTVIVKERSAQLKMPTDLLGLTVLDYQGGSAAELDASLGPICEQIRRLVRAAGPK